MSTFKRLFNIGKGKAKVVSREAGEAFGDVRTTVGEGQWADDVRHRAADAAEALAGALRPEDVQLHEAPTERVHVAQAEAKPKAPVSAAASAPETPKPSEPKKRRL